MPLPGTLPTPTRDEIRDKYLRDFKLRLPSADISAGTQPWIDACTLADNIFALYAGAIALGYRTNVSTNTGDALVAFAGDLGLSRSPARGASGTVTIAASSGGGTIMAGDQLTDPNTGLRFQVQSTGTYLNNGSVQIVGTDTGPRTNLSAGSKLTFTSPRPGIGPIAVVSATAAGLGLTGGAVQASDEQLQQRILLARQTRAASGNAAQYVALAEDSASHGVPVEKAFVFPANLGSGTVALAFTVLGNGVPLSRFPSATQINTVYNYIRSQMPADDNLFMLAPLEDAALKLDFRITWQPGGVGWSDAVPFPAAVGLTGFSYIPCATGSTATSINISTNGFALPQVGQTFGLFNKLDGQIYKKRILAITGTVPGLTLTIDTTNNVSDVTFAPPGGISLFPWSDSLPEIHARVMAQINSLTPGDLVGTFYDVGTRQRRYPLASNTYPNVVGTGFISSPGSAPNVLTFNIQEAPIGDKMFGRKTAVGYNPSYIYIQNFNEINYLPPLP